MPKEMGQGYCCGHYKAKQFVRRRPDLPGVGLLMRQAQSSGRPQQLQQLWSCPHVVPERGTADSNCWSRLYLNRSALHEIIGQIHNFEFHNFEEL
jgi:hypothetical protein